MSRGLLYALSFAFAVIGSTSASHAEWVTRSHRWVSPRGPWNWAMSREHPDFYKEQNGIGFGHAHIAETLLNTQDAQKVERARLEVLEFIFTSPSVPPDEEQVAPTFVRMVWEAQQVFNWAHAFHNNLWDLFASDEVTDKRQAYEEILKIYLSKPEAITPHPLDHTGKLSTFPESASFYSKFPKFTTQIWSYHWLQAAAYDVQLLGNASKQRELMRPLIKLYHGYLRNPPVDWTFMPMMFEAAPEFSRDFPEASAIFDNLHMLHDNIDDVLSRPDLYPGNDEKRAAILKILPIYLHQNHTPEDRYKEFDAVRMHGKEHHAMNMPTGPRPPSAQKVINEGLR